MNSFFTQFAKNALLAILIALGCDAMQSSSHAALVTWTGGMDTTWDNGANWNSDGSLKPTAADDVVLPIGVPANGSVITLISGELANSLTINNDYILSGGDLTLTAGNGGVVSASFGKTATIASKLTGAAGFTKDGRGTIRLTNSANDYTGATTIGQGSVLITDAKVLGSDSSAIVVSGNGVRGNGGGNLSIGGGITFTRDLAITGYGVSGDTAAFTSFGNNTLTGNITTCANWGGFNASGVLNTSSNTVLTSASGTATLSTGAITLAASTTYFGGRGDWIINSTIDGVGSLAKNGAGTLTLTGSNTYSGTTAISAGFLRVSQNSALGVSTSSGALTLSGGTLEIRSDAPDFNSRKVTAGASTATIYVDRAVGGDGLNETVTFGALTLGAGKTVTFAGRNGYSVTFSSVTGGSLGGDLGFANSSNGKVTFTGNMWGQTNTSARTLTLTATGDMAITGSLTATGAAHVFTKAGTGTLTILGTSSTHTGITNVLLGTMAIADFGSINVANTSAINLGSTSYYAAIDVIGSPSSITNATTSRTINMVGTTGGTVLLANQSKTALLLTGNINNTGAGNKTLFLGGASALDNTIQGVISNYSGSTYTTSLTKVGSGTWMLAGSNTYTGNTTIAQGVLKLKDTTGSTDILSSTGAVVFNASAFNQAAGGILNYVGYDTGSTEQVGALTATAGAATVMVTAGTSGTTTLEFTSLGARSNGATVDFVPGSGKIKFTTPSTSSGLINIRGATYGGVDWAALDGDGYVVAYAGYTPLPSSGSLSSTGNYVVSSNGSISGSTSINTLKLIGSESTTAVTLDGTLTLNARGLLFDNTNGSALITGGQLGASTNEVIIITNGTGSASNVLTIESPIASGNTGFITKSGTGTLVIAGVNTYTGNTTINEGTVRLSGSGTLGDITVAGNVTSLRQAGTLDLNGVSVTIGALMGAGKITNSGSASAVLSLGIQGTTTANGYFTGIIEDNGTNKISVIQNSSGTESLTGLNTYTGSTVLAAGTVAVTTLADIGAASGIGKGDATSDATNAASLVFAGGMLQYTGSTTTIYQTTQTPSVSTNRLFTLAGNGMIDSSGTYGSPYVNKAGAANNATLIFSNTGPVVFSGTGDRTLTLTGTSTGDNEIRLRLIDNPNGGTLSITKSGVGVWALGNTSNSYSGTTTIAQGTLRALDGKSLPTDSALLFAASSSYYGTFESIGTFTRGLGTGAGQVSWSSSTTGGGGFAAADSKLTVAIGGTSSPTSLVWGSGGFTSGYLVLNSATALAEVELVNNIDLNGATRTIQVDDNTYAGTDFATISGNISGTGGITKTGNGTLYLTGTNTYTGDTAVNAGSLMVTSLGSSTGTGNSSVGVWSSNKVTVGSGTTTAYLTYLGTGETSDRLIEMGGSTTGSAALIASGTDAWVLSNVTGGSGTGARTLYLRGDSYANNEITGATAVLTDGTGGGTVSVTKDDNATWILSGQNKYSGGTTVTIGLLGIGASSIVTDGTLISGPVGVGALTLANGTVFAAGADRTLDNAITIASSSTNAVIGDYSMTWNGVVTLGTGSSSITLTNSISAGSLTINGDVQYIATATNNKAFIINGGGNTIIAGKISEATTSYTLNLAYNGYGSLTLANSGNSYSGGTTLSGGTLIIGADNALPYGIGKGDLTINPGTGLTARLDLKGHALSLNGLTASSLGTTIIDNSSATGASLVFGNNDKDVTYIGSITQTGGGAVSITKTGSGTAILSQGPYNYTGSTTINGGTMTISGAVTGTTGISVTGNSTLNLAGSLTGSASTIVSIVVDAGSTLSLYNGVGTPLSNLATVSLGTGTSGTATLELNLGDTGSDTLTIVSGGTYSIANKVTFNIRDVDMSGNTSYTLLSLSSSATGSLGDLSNYTIGTAPGGYLMPTGGWLSLSTDGLNLLFNTGSLVTGTIYWGNRTGDGKWNTGSGSNWFTDKAGTTAALVNPGAGSDVIFIADTLTGGGAVTTTLEQDFKVNSLTFEASTTSTNTPSSVIIEPGADSSYRLNISPQVNTYGITIAAGGPPSVEIKANLKLGANQTWTVADAASTLKVSGALTGTGNLITTGSGKVILATAADSAFGASSVTVSGGTLELNNATALGSSVVGNLAAITIGSGGTFYYAGSTATTSTTGVANPITLNGGTLSVAGNTQYYLGNLTLTADSFVSLADYGISTSASARSLYYTGTISGNHKITVSSYATTSAGNITGGAFVPTADNSGWTGGLQIDGGTVYAKNINALGSGAITASLGRLIFDNGTNDQTYNFSNSLTIDGTSGNAILEYHVNNASSTPVNFTVNQSGKITLGGSGAAPILRLYEYDTGSIIAISGGIELKANATIHTSSAAAAYAAPTIVINGTGISESGGSYSLTINGDTIWGSNNYQNIEIDVASTHTGGTTLAAGRLILNHLQAIGITGDLTLNGGYLRLGVDMSGTNAFSRNLNIGGTATLEGDNFEVTGTITNVGGNRTLNNNLDSGKTLTITGDIKLSNDDTGRTFTIGGSGTTLISGAITDGGASAGTFAYTGTGVLTLTATNTYTGGTTVNGGTSAGTLVVASTSNLSSGSLTVNAGTLELNNAGQSVSALTMGGGASGTTSLIDLKTNTLTLAGNVTYTASTSAKTATIQNGTVDMGDTTRTFTVNDSTAVVTTDPEMVLSATLIGTGGLTKAGTGTLAMVGLNTFGGAITVSAGTLQYNTITNSDSTAACSLGQGSNAITLSGGALSFVGDSSQSTNREITFTASSTLDASGVSGATIDYTGAINAGGNYLYLTGTGEGTISGAIIQSGTSADFYVNSGTWHLSNGANYLSDNVYVTGSTTVLTLDVAGVLNAPQGTIYLRTGGTLRLNADDAITSTTDGINVATDAAGEAYFNLNGYNASAPVLYLGGNNATDTYTGVISGEGTLSITTTINLYRGSVSSNLAGAGTITKDGPGTVTLSGDNSGLTGATAVSLTAGNLILDYTTSNAVKLREATGLTGNGGTLTIVGNASAATSQAVSALSLGWGWNTITIQPGTGQTATLNVNAISRSVGKGVIRFELPALTSGGVITTSTATNGILGGWATIKDSAGETNFATVDSNGYIIAATSTTKNDVTTWLAGENVTDSTGYTGTLTAFSSVNSIRFNGTAASTVTIGSGQVLTVTSGGILATDAMAGAATITGGTLAPGTGNELIIATDSTTQSLTIASAISGATIVTKSGSGTLVLSGSSYSSGAVNIFGGTVVAQNGNAIGDYSTVTLADDHDSALTLESNEAIGALGGGSLYYSSSVNVGSHTLIVNETASTNFYGNLTGDGTIVKTGAGNLVLYGSSGFTGSVVVNAGLLQLYQGGRLVSASDFSVNNSALLLDNRGSTRSSDRIASTASITLNSANGVSSGGAIPYGLWIRTDYDGETSETFGPLVFNSGANYVTLEATSTTSSKASCITRLNAANFVRNNHATVDVRGMYLGVASGERTQLRITTTANETAFMTANLVGGGGSTSSTNTSIIPWAIGESLSVAATVTNMGNTLMTYVASQGFVPLDLTTNYTNYSASADATDNVRESLTASLTGLTGKSINSLVIHNNQTTTTDTITVSGTGTLTNTSGAFLFTLNTGATASTNYNTMLAGFDNIQAGSTNEYIFHVVNPSSATTTPTLTVTVDSLLNSTGAALVKSGLGTLVLTKENTYEGGTVVNEGLVQFASLGNIGTGSVTLNGGGIVYTGTAAFDRTLTIGSGGGTIDSNGNIIVAHALSGSGGLTKSGSGTLTLSSTSDHNMGGSLTLGRLNTTTDAGSIVLNANATFGGLVVQAANSSATASTLTIADGKTLTITGNVTIGSSYEAVTTTWLAVNGGGSLTISNTATGGYVTVGGTTTGASKGNRTTADFSGLGTLNIALNASSGTLRVNPTNSNALNSAYSTFILAETTNITAANLNVGDGGQFTSGTDQVNQLKLGSGVQTIYVNTVNIGTGGRDLGSITFNDVTGSLILRAADGSGRVAFNMGTGTASTAATVGSNANRFDVTDHEADLYLGAVSISTQNRRGGNMNSVFSFNTGTLDMTSLTMSTRGTAGTTDGTIDLGGGTVRIGTGAGTAVTLATNTSTGTATATMNLTGGDITILGDVVRGDNTSTGTATGIINLDGASLDMSGFSIGSATNAIAFNTTAGSLSNVHEINGGSTLTKTGTGILTLAGTNSYTGVTAVNEGTVLVTSSEGLGSTAGGTTVASGAILALSGNIAIGAEALTLAGTYSNPETAGVLSNASGVNSFGGDILISGAGVIQAGGGTTLNLTGSIAKADSVLAFYGSGTINVNGVISGNAANYDDDLVVAGAVVQLNAQNTYTGPTYVASGGTLRNGTTDALPSVSTVGATGSTSLILGHSTDGAVTNTYDLNGFDQTIATVTSASAGGNSNIITNSGSTNSTLSVSAGSFGGTIRDGGSKVNLVKQGDNSTTLVLAGANSYTGTTQVRSGVLNITGSLGNTAVTVGHSSISGLTPTLTGGIGAGNGGVLFAPANSPSRQLYTPSGTIGAIAGSVTLNGAGTGGSAGQLFSATGTVSTLQVGSLTINSGSTLNWQFNDSANSFVNVTGVLSITGGGINLYNESAATQFATNGTYNVFQFGSLSGSASNLTVLNSLAGHSYTFTTLSVDGANYVTLTIADVTNTSRLTGASPVVVRVMAGTSSTPTSLTISNSGVDSANYTLGSSGTNAVALSSTTGTVAATSSDSSISVGWADTATAGARSGSIAITNTSNPADTPAAIAVTGAVVADRVLTASNVNLGLVHAGTGATSTLTTTGEDYEATRLSLAGSATTITGGGATIASSAGDATLFDSGSSSQTLNVTLAAGTYSGNVNIAGLVNVDGTETASGAASPTTINVSISAQVFSGNGTWSGGSGSWGTGASTNWADENGVQAAPGTFGVAYANTDTATFSGTGGTVTLDSAVSLKSITFTNSAYTIAAGGGSLALASNSGTATVTVSGGTASHAINAPVTVDSSSNLQVSVIGGATLTFGANVTVDSGKSLIVGDATHTGTTVLVGTNNTAGSTVINYGTLQVGDGTTASRLISSTITLYNSGELNLQANAAVTASGGLNLYDNSKVTGVGTVNGNVTLHNSSTFQSTSLILNGTLTAVSGSSGSTTAGTATTVTGNTTVEGTFTVVGSSTYTSEGTVDVSGSLANPALFNVGGTVTSVGGITVSSYGTLSIDSGANVGTTGTGGVTTNVVLSGGTVGNNGTINGNLNVNGTGGALSGSGVVSGTVNVTAGTFTVNADGGNPSSFTAQSIVVSGSGTQFNLNGQTATVQQSMSVGSGSSFTTGVGGHLIDNGSTITWDSNSLVTVNADASVVSKHVIINGTGNLVESAGSVGTSGGLIQIQATGDGLELSGATLTLQSDSSYNRAGKLILDSGAGSANASQTVAGGAGLWVHAGASTIKSSGTGTVAGSVNLGGGQTVFLDSNASLNLQNLNVTNGNLTVQAKDNTGKLLFSGSNTVEGAVSILSGVLGGTGGTAAVTVASGLTVGVDATLQVGDKTDGTTAGKFTVDGDTLIQGTLSSNLYTSTIADLLVVSDGTVTLGSSSELALNLYGSLTGRYLLVQNDSFDYTTQSFTTVSWNDDGGAYKHDGYYIDYHYLNTGDGKYYIALVPEPSTWAMLLTASMMGATGYWWRRRRSLSTSQAGKD